MYKVSFWENVTFFTKHVSNKFCTKGGTVCLYVEDICLELVEDLLNDIIKKKPL
jgi:hypothetical protein